MTKRKSLALDQPNLFINATLPSSGYMAELQQVKKLKQLSSFAVGFAINIARKIVFLIVFGQMSRQSLIIRSEEKPDVEASAFQRLKFLFVVVATLHSRSVTVCQEDVEMSPLACGQLTFLANIRSSQL